MSPGRLHAGSAAGPAGERLSFAPVGRRSLADGVREQLASTIRSGALAPGGMLPSEEALSGQFAVSRTSVREAIRELITLGLVERRGNRAHVVEHLPSLRLDADVRRDRIHEVFETRRVLEVQLTEYAAARATPEQREQLVALARRIRTATGVEELRPLDRAFHAAVAEAAHNPLLGELHAKVLDAVFESGRYGGLLGSAAGDDPAADGEVLTATRSLHARIAAAIADGDVPAARAAALRHLDDAERRLTR